MVNINQFIKQAQGMQQKMQELQDQLSKQEYLGQSGGGVVEVTITGKGDLLKINISPTIIKVEEKEILEDLIVAAFNDAKTKIDAASQNSFNGLFGNVNLPPGFKMPF